MREKKEEKRKEKRKDERKEKYPNNTESRNPPDKSKLGSIDSFVETIDEEHEREIKEEGNEHWKVKEVEGIG